MAANTRRPSATSPEWLQAERTHRKVTSFGRVGLLPCISPGKDHYGAMVDLLGRAGRLREAWEFIEAMPAVPGISVFGALLGACKIHRDVGMAEKAAERLFLLEPADGGYHFFKQKTAYEITV